MSNPKVYTLIGGPIDGEKNDLELQLIDRAAYDKLQAQLLASQQHEEMLMNIDYWPSRCRELEVEIARLLAKIDSTETKE